MANNLSSKQYVVGFGAGDITTGSFVATLGTFGSSTINYKKVGKLYFDIWCNNGGGIQFFFGDDVTTRAEVENVILTGLGLTVDTWYAGQNYGAYIGTYSGSWTATPPANNTRPLLMSFLAN